MKSGRQLAAVRSEIADDHTDTAMVQQTADTPPADTPDAIQVQTLQATAARPTSTQPFGATPANPVQQATYSPPWPVYHHPRRPTRTVQRRRISLPGFLVVFKQNLQTLFR